MNRPAAIYARVSSDRQKENHTITSQTAALKEYAQTHDYLVPTEWVFEDEGYSGATLVPGLEALRDLAARGEIQNGAGVLAGPVEPQIRLSGAAGGGVAALRGIIGFLEGACRRDRGRSFARTVSGHDRGV